MNKEQIISEPQNGVGDFPFSTFLLECPPLCFFLSLFLLISWQEQRVINITSNAP